jgi:hypothetical protein
MRESKQKYVNFTVIAGNLEGLGTVAATNAGRNAFERHQIASSLAIKSYVCNTFPVVLVI